MYSSPAEAQMAVDRGALTVRAKIKVRLTHQRPPRRRRGRAVPGGLEDRRRLDRRDHPGPRAVQRAAAARTTRSSTSRCRRSVQATIINDLAERYPMIVVAQTVDKLKDAGFYWATRSGVTVSMSDVLVPPEKAEIIDGYEAQADEIEKKYQRGALNKPERNRRAGQDLEGSHRRGR